MAQILATLVVLFKPSLRAEWIEKKRFDLVEPTITLGRARDCDLIIDYRRVGEKTYVSRHHASLFKQEDLNDYEIMDGTLTEATIANPDPIVLPSACGTVINGKKLDAGEKRLLKDRDRISLVPDRVEIIYFRKQNKVLDTLEELTYVPELITGESTTDAISPQRNGDHPTSPSHYNTSH